MTPQEMIDVIVAHRDGKQIESMPYDGGNLPEWMWSKWIGPQFDFIRFKYRIVASPRRPVTLEELGIINAHRQGKAIERRLGGTLLNWKPVAQSEELEFDYWKYRIKSAALRPHWPALIRTPNNGVIFTRELYPSEDCAAHAISFIRLATEYPPVMLP